VIRRFLARARQNLTPPTMAGYLAAILSLFCNVASQVILSGVLRRVAFDVSGVSLVEVVRRLCCDGMFWAGAGAAALTLVSWAFALSQLPLARILPIMALLFLFSPLLAWLVYGERLSAINLAGFVVLTTGVILSAWK